MEKSELTEVRRLDINTMSRRESVGVLLMGMGLYLILYEIGAMMVDLPLNPNQIWIVLAFTCLALVLHELAHGLVFYIYTGKVKFGFKWKTKLGFVAYASSPGAILERRRMVIVALAPQVMTVLILVVLPILSHNAWLFYSLLSFAGFNLGGGSADLYGVWLIMRQRGKIFVEDTGTGTIIYRRGEV